MGIGSIQKIPSGSFVFLKREFGTNWKESEKKQKTFERGEMVKRRGVDRRVAEFKVKKARS